jgi:hypothetical protein
MKCCPLSSCDSQAQCSTTRVRKARKEHTCCECDLKIQPGQSYEVISGVWDGQPQEFKTCLSCMQIRDHFQCDGFQFETLWRDLEENFFPGMKAGGPCMEGLSPENKERLFTLRQEWLLSNPRSVNPRPYSVTKSDGSG